MNHSPRQLSHLDGVEQDSKRRRERNKKKNPEDSLNQGPKTMKYIQTKRERSMYRIIYIVFSIVSFLLSVLVYFLSDMTDGLLGLITIWAAMVVGIAHIYRTTTQLVIDDAMTEAMYLLAVRNFQLVNLIYAVIMTAASVITILLTTSASPQKTISIIAIILACVLAWIMPVLEFRRKIEPCIEK